MKKIYYAAMLAIGLTACTQTQAPNIVIDGETQADATGWIYLKKFNNKLWDTVDSVQINDGKFKFEENLVLPELYGLTTTHENTPFFIFLEEGEVQVKFDGARTQVTGSSVQDEYNAYLQQPNVDIKEYIQQHPTSIVANYVFYRNYSYRLTADQIREYIDYLDPSLQNSAYTQVLRQLADKYDQVSIGRTAPDFEIEDLEGKTVKLSDFYAGNKYILVDFWAAWCPPCRAENPNVVANYQRFHDKGFDVVGVSLDKTREEWVKGIEDDGLTWHHVSDLVYWNSAPADLYGVRAIPANFLLDNTGKIVAKNLRGEQLTKKLEELL
ncbi:MAG: AhpC/TSA family protein [Bacteroidaceae bacterium]|nr:AhpC/TSA family protein [Bacteroidaceae bacterium]